MGQSRRLTGGLRSRVTLCRPSETELKDAHNQASEMKIITLPPVALQPLNSRVLADDMEQTEPQLQMGFHWPARAGMYINFSGWLDDGSDNVSLFRPLEEKSSDLGRVLLFPEWYESFLNHTIIFRVYRVSSSLPSLYKHCCPFLHAITL